MKNRYASAALSALLGLSVPVLAGAADTTPFPRIAATMFGGSRDFELASVQANLSKFNIALIGPWLGWEQAKNYKLEQAIDNIKGANPSELVFIYENINEIPLPNPGDKVDVANAANQNNWMLYQSGTSGAEVNSTWSTGFYILNTTLFTPKNSSGQNYLDWRAAYQVSKYADAPGMDGFITDNFQWKPRVDGDWNRDGITDSQSSATTQSWFRSGYAHYISDLKALMPGKYQAGNVDWSAATTPLPEYSGILNLGMNEGMIGYSWSYETWGGWSGMMKAYRALFPLLASPQIEVFMMVGSATDYQTFRYGLASCLMDNGYFTFNTTSEYADAVWFDEYGASLGQATSNPPSAPWQNGVYRRDFANGIALVNPKGNGAQTVTLETTYKRIAGTQAPAVNNGQNVQAVTLNDRDGIILLRLNSQSVATPAAPKSVVVQ